jgi:predicted acetyltransferase
MSEWAEADREWYTFAWKPGMRYSEMLEILAREARGEVPEGRVPGSMLYAFVGGKIVGRVSLRHELNGQLRKRGGHIGYSVAAAYRGKGYATEMMRQALVECARLGMKKLLITCSDSNVPSWKIIEHFGGVLEAKVPDAAKPGELVRRYWLEVPVYGS